jgi:glycine betaine/proline transport system ATP-binding protein
MVFQAFGPAALAHGARQRRARARAARARTRRRGARVDEELALVTSTSARDALVGELSGGMQQRVGLARAFATDAPILLMDEPFSALDPLIRGRLQDELLSLQAKRNRTIVFVSHDLDEAFKLGNRIAIMDGGRIIQAGTPRDIFTNPATPYVADFVAHMNPLGVLRARDVMGPATGPEPDFGIGPDADIRSVMERLRKSKALAVRQGAQTLGHITAEGVLARLLDPRA